MAMVSMEKPRSAEKTRPRKRSSVFNCKIVVEKTQTVDPPQWARTMHSARHPYVRRPAQAEISDSNREIAKQNAKLKPTAGVTCPAGGEQRSHHGADPPRPQQQAHAQHGRPLGIDPAHVHVEVAVAHDGEEHPTGTDHELTGFGKDRCQQAADPCRT